MKKITTILKSWLNPYRNIFLVVSLIFIFWMLFFDANSWLIHRELNKEIENLNSKKEFYKKELQRDTKELEALKTEEGLEHYARETYNMKRENEDIYIIAIDSTTTQE